MIRMCCVCGRVELRGKWVFPIAQPENGCVTHGYCPECFEMTLMEIEQLAESKVQPVWANHILGFVG